MTATGQHDVENFEAHRRSLMGLAYRMLGSRAEAEDVVQDAYLRWHAADRSAIERTASLSRHGGDAAVPRPHEVGASAARTSMSDNGCRSPWSTKPSMTARRVISRTTFPLL